jgi:hypothetical protein
LGRACTRDRVDSFLLCDPCQAGHTITAPHLQGRARAHVRLDLPPPPACRVPAVLRDAVAAATAGETVKSSESMHGRSVLGRFWSRLQRDRRV